MAACLAFAAADASAAPPHDSTPYEIPIPTERYASDLDVMVERRTIRVLTVYSKTLFFIDEGTPRRIAYDALTAFGAELGMFDGAASSPMMVTMLVSTAKPASLRDTSLATIRSRRCGRPFRRAGAISLRG